MAPSAVVPFEDGLRKQLHSVAKVNKNVKFLAGLDEARRSMDEYRNGGAKASYGVRTRPMGVEFLTKEG